MGRLTPALPANLRPVDAGEGCDRLSGVRNNADGPFWAERKNIGGEMLFQMRVDREDCQLIAAVRIGIDEKQRFALVIMPPGGGLMRVEPVEQSSNPLALITESYASLMDTFRAAA
jgi:hypothetical protein